MVVVLDAVFADGGGVEVDACGAVGPGWGGHWCLFVLGIAKSALGGFGDRDLLGFVMIEGMGTE